MASIYRQIAKRDSVVLDRKYKIQIGKLDIQKERKKNEKRKEIENSLKIFGDIRETRILKIDFSERN